MLITAGIVALSQKVSNDKAKRRETRQGLLRDSEATRSANSTGSDIRRTGSDIKYEDPSDIAATSPDAASPTLYSSETEFQDVRHTSEAGLTSPVKSETAFLGPGSAYPAETPTTPTILDGQRSRSSTLQSPPPYSPDAGEYDQSSFSRTLVSRGGNLSTRDRADTRSISTRSTNSVGTHAIRVKTRGADLKSGFAYHPALFDLRVHPDKWDSFTNDVVTATKTTSGDKAKVWAAATGVALTGAWATSVFVGSTVGRQLKEQRVKEGLEDNAAGSLGDKLKLWNEMYFNKQGLYAHLELSESAMKREGKSTAWRKPSFFYSKDEDRERKKDERKFVIVITKLDADGQPTEALHEMGGDVAPVEIETTSGVVSQAAELPAEVFAPVELPADTVVELPADTSFVDKKDTEDIFPYVEMDSDNSRLLEKFHIEDHTDRTRTIGKEWT